ncbi:MAG TPA: hypothetical protein VFC19_29350 [Candidatus Limnocylindrales bacterium]|nr:hypothetical protein [Candidatus Limnocylindrales bacterium]
MRLLMTKAELATPGGPQAVGSALFSSTMPEPASEILQTLARPAMQLLVQLFTSASTAGTAATAVTHRIWLRDGAAVLGQATGDGGAELSMADPVLVPYAVAQLVGLRRRPPPLGRKPIQVPLATYRAVEAGEAQMPELAAVLRSRRLSWRVSSAVPSGSTRPVVKWLHVTDAGPAGLWRITVDHSDHGQSGVALTPMRAREVWWALHKEVFS